MARIRPDMNAQPLTGRSTYPETTPFSSSGVSGGTPFNGVGFPVSAPTRDLSAVRDQLGYLHLAYPSELFHVEPSSEDESKLVVSWIPANFSFVVFGQLLYDALYTASSWGPWTTAP